MDHNNYFLNVTQWLKSGIMKLKLVYSVASCENIGLSLKYSYVENRLVRVMQPWARFRSDSTNLGVLKHAHKSYSGIVFVFFLRLYGVTSSFGLSLCSIRFDFSSHWHLNC